MSEFEDLYSNEFFIIDSEKLKNVKTELYGYLIDDGEIYTSNNINPNVKITKLGNYIYIDKTNDTISIHQDCEGSYGIYVYKYDDYFCISNSFIKLVDYIKDKYPISFNKDASNAFLSCKFSSYLYKQTLVNEIELIPRNYIVKITIAKKTIEYESYEICDKTIPLDSKEAFDILDSWFYRWTSLFRNLKKETNNISVDLTGGFDSRLTFSLILASNINLNEIKIRSMKDENYTHKEDYEIASKMAERFNFKLNDESNFNINRYHFKDIETSVNLSAYVKLGTHNQLFFKTYKDLNPCYSITGYGGENIRNYLQTYTLERYLKDINLISPDFVNSTKKILNYNIANLKSDFKNIYSDENIEFAIYRESVLRYHFGNGSTEKYLTNNITLTPLTDPELNKIKRFDENCNDKNLLISIIYTRYCPEILDFDFEGDSEIFEETIEYAKKLNKKFPFKFKGYSQVSKTMPSQTIHSNETKNYITENNVVDYLKNIFFSNAFKKYFETYFSTEIYDKLALKVKTLSYVPLQYATPPFLILKVIDAIKINKYDSCEDISEWLTRFTKLDENNLNNYKDTIINKLLNYNTARIDLTNLGNGNNIELISSTDNKQLLKIPSWIDSKMGAGIIIESFKNSISLKIKCIQSGELRIALRGKDIRDSKRKRFPIYIDFTKLKINDELIFNENKLVWHDNPYVYTKKVSDGEILILNIEWKPFSVKSTYHKT